MNSAGEPLCDKCSVNRSVDCPPRLNLSYFLRLGTQIILRIYPINRPPVAQTAHSLFVALFACTVFLYLADHRQSCLYM